GGTVCCLVGVLAGRRALSFAASRLALRSLTESLRARTAPRRPRGCPDRPQAETRAAPGMTPRTCARRIHSTPLARFWRAELQSAPTHPDALRVPGAAPGRPRGNLWGGVAGLPAVLWPADLSASLAQSLPMTDQSVTVNPAKYSSRVSLNSGAARASASILPTGDGRGTPN